MPASFRLAPEVESQLGDILAFIATDNEPAAMRVRDAIYQALGMLASMPAMGHKLEDLTDRPVKFWSVFSYLIVYDPASSPLTVVAVLHGAQDVERRLKLE